MLVPRSVIYIINGKFGGFTGFEKTTLQTMHKEIKLWGFEPFPEKDWGKPFRKHIWKRKHLKYTEENNEFFCVTPKKSDARWLKLRGLHQLICVKHFCQEPLKIEDILMLWHQQFWYGVLVIGCFLATEIWKLRLTGPWFRLKKEQ